MDCCCQDDRGTLDQEVLDAFAVVREGCPALKRILVPDQVWRQFREWDGRLRDDDLHRSILLLAMARGHLSRITAPLHRYLIAADAPCVGLSQQYLQDLQERWVAYEDPVERNRKSRAFLGRLVELQCAEWLESQGWTILELEAFQQGPDIKACDGKGAITSFEVKFIGREDEDFVLVLNSLRGKSAGRWKSHYAAANYLLFRAYEAAKQLQRTDTGRIALLVVSEATWSRFRLPLIDNWIDWHNPRFVDDGDRSWKAFLKDQRPRYPQLDRDLRPALHDLDAIWILQLLFGFNYRREFECEMRSA